MGSDLKGKQCTDFSLFVAVFLGCTSTGRVGLCFLWFYVQELPKAQPAVDLVLKGQRHKVSSDRLGEAGNRNCDPWFTCTDFLLCLRPSLNVCRSGDDTCMYVF